MQSGTHLPSPQLSLFFLNWSVVDSQCHANCCTAKWLSYTHTDILFHYCLSQHIEYSSLGYTIGPCCLPILYIVVCIYQPQTPSPSLSLPTITTITQYFLEVLSKAIKQTTEKRDIISGNKTNLSFPDEEWLFSLENQEHLLKIYSN